MILHHQFYCVKVGIPNHYGELSSMNVFFSFLKSLILGSNQNKTKACEKLKKSHRYFTKKECRTKFLRNTYLSPNHETIVENHYGDIK